MTRDTYLFIGFVAVFALINGALLASGMLQGDWTGFGIIAAAGLTLSIYSFLYKDNPLFKFAEHVFVGVAAGYVFGQVWYPTIYGEVIATFKWSLAVPVILGLLMLTRLSAKMVWPSRLAFAFFVGTGAGFTIPRYISSFVLAQVEPSLKPLTWSIEGLNLFIVLIGVVSVLVYFFFSVEHTGVVGKASKVGIWFLMVSFGASFGYTIMARLSLLIGRVGFLMKDWLGLQTPMF